MLSEILNAEIVAGIDISRTHVVLTILFMPYNTIPRYYDEWKGGKKKRKNVLLFGIFCCRFWGFFLMKRWNFPFKKMKSTIIIIK